MLFTERPKAGGARKLWDWFTRQQFTFDYEQRTKETGSPPDSLCVIRSGYRQRQAGAAQYEIEWNHISFYVHWLEDTLSGDANPKRTDTWYYL